MEERIFMATESHTPSHTTQPPYRVYPRHSPDSPTNLDLFREKITDARRQAGRLQKELAGALGIDAKVLSRKLHGAKQTFLTHEQVKKMIKTLASWDAISTQVEAIELLTLMGLRKESFSNEEWKTAPLDRLEPPRKDSAHVATVSTAHFIIPSLPVIPASL